MLSKPADDLPMLLTASMIRASVLPIGRRTFQRYVASGTFPPPDLRISGKGYWKRETIFAWLSSQTATAAVEVAHAHD